MQKTSKNTTVTLGKMGGTRLRPTSGNSTHPGETAISNYYPRSKQEEYQASDHSLSSSATETTVLGNGSSAKAKVDTDKAEFENKIIQVLINSSASERLKLLPDVFNSSGQLKWRYHYLRPRAKETRELLQLSQKYNAAGEQELRELQQLPPEYNALEEQELPTRNVPSCYNCRGKCSRGKITICVGGSDTSPCKPCRDEPSQKPCRFLKHDKQERRESKKRKRANLPTGHNQTLCDPTNDNLKSTHNDSRPEDVLPHDAPLTLAQQKCCEVCQRTCSCDTTQQQERHVQCGGPSIGLQCPQHSFTETYLRKYCGIRLEDIHDLRNTHESRCWLCPTCSQQYNRTIKKEETETTAIKRIPSLYGREHLNDEEIDNKLDALDIIILRYIQVTRKKPLLQYDKVPFWELDFIHKGEPGSELIVNVFREALDVPDGVTIAAQAINLRLQSLEAIDMLRGILALICCQLMEDSTSPFEDVATLRESLVHSFSEDVASIIIQDQRLRVAKTEEFKVKSAQRIASQTAKFNSIMLPLVGASSELNALHREMVKVADSVHNDFHAYGGTLEPIWPRIGDEFDRKDHTLNYEPEEFDLEYPRQQQVILWVVRGGFRYRPFGKDWRVCSRAKVILRDVRASGKAGLIPTVQGSVTDSEISELIEIED